MKGNHMVVNVGNKKYELNQGVLRWNEGSGLSTFVFHIEGNEDGSLTVYVPSTAFGPSQGSALPQDVEHGAIEISRPCPTCGRGE